MGINVAAQIVKSGTLVLFGTPQDTAAADGAYPMAPVTSVAGTPSLFRGGAPISIGPATWTGVTKDSPWVAYLLGCGAVRNVAILRWGEGYQSAPTASAAGVTFGAVQMATGITSYAVNTPGSGYPQPPSVTIADSGGGTGAAGYLVVWSGMIVAYVPTAGGSGYTAAATLAPNYTGVSGSGATLTPIVQGGAIVGANVVTPGSGHSNGPVVTAPAPSGTGGPAGNLTAGALAIVGDASYATPGGVRAVIPYLGVAAGQYGGPGTGYTGGTATATVAAPASGTTATITGNVSTYVSNVPVVSSVSTFDAPPTITLSGGNPTTAASVAPIMSGASASDVFTYSAPAGWLVTASGSAPAATLAAVVNSAGQLEPDVMGMAAFAQTPTMPAGVNMGSQPVVAGTSTFTAKNLMHKGQWWTVSSGTSVITYQADGQTPAAWTNAASTLLDFLCYGPNSTNKLDGMGQPAYSGTFVGQYDDPGANTAAANAVWLGSSNTTDAANHTFVPYPLSGDAAPVAIPAGNITLSASGGGITAVSLSGISLASNYQGAALYCTDSAGSGFAAVVEVAAGRPSSVVVIGQGKNYVAPTIQLYGTGLSGQAITFAVTVEPVANPTEWNPRLALFCANSAGSWTMGNPWVVAPNADGTPNLSIDRTRPFAVDDNVKSYLVSGSGAVGLTRDMDADNGFSGTSNVAFPSDVVNVGTGTAWMSLATQRTISLQARYCRYMNTNPASATYSWSSTKAYSHLAYSAALDPPIATTGSTVQGSPVVVPAAIDGLMAGASVSGPGIPAGSIVAYGGMQVIGTIAKGSTLVTGLATTANMSTGMPVNGTGIPAGATISAVGSLQLTLSVPATASNAASLNIGNTSLFTLGSPSGGLAAATATGSGVTLQIQNPGHVALPTTDDGFSVQNNFSPGSEVVMELRFLTPHFLRDGDNINLGGDVTVPYTGPVLSTTGNNAAWQTTGATTSGSAVVTGVADAALYQPRSPVVGAGIPAGTTIAAVGSGQLTLSQAATATTPPGMPATLTITAYRPNVFGTASAEVYVTGPYTIAVYFFVPGGAAPPVPLGQQVINATAEIDLSSAAYPGGWVITHAVPLGGATNSQPPEYGSARDRSISAATVRWVNLQPNASDALIALRAAKDAAQVGSNPVYLEYSNEIWNNASAFPIGVWLYGVSTRIGYIPSGTILGYATAPTGTLAGQVPAGVLMSAHAFDVYQSAFVAAGGSSSQIRRVLGSQWAGANITQNTLKYAQAWGVAPDYVCVAPYLDLPSDWPIASAFSPAGSPVGGAGCWPIDAINDLVRFWMAYSQANWNLFSGHAQYCRNFGQPLAGAQVSASGTGGSIPSGNYYLYYTFVDGSGLETTVGLSQSGNALSVASGKEVVFTLPVWPQWAASIRLYISANGAAAGVPPVAYASIALAGQSYGATATVGSFPTSAAPPTTNLAASHTPRLPAVVAYEGGIQVPIPATVPLQYFLEHDSRAHPSARDVIFGWYLTMQQGNPTAADSGLAGANYYSLYGVPQYQNMFFISCGPCQPPGPGTSNRFATIQGGQPADGHDHNQSNDSPGFQGLRDFFSRSPSPTPTPTSTARRRWWPGLPRGRPASS